MTIGFRTFLVWQIIPSLSRTGQEPTLRFEHPKVDQLGYVQALLTNIRQGGKGLTVSNALAYLDPKAVTSFITLTPGPNILKLYVRNLRISVISYCVWH
jgi:hypothetical protein